MYTSIESRHAVPLHCWSADRKGIWHLEKSKYLLHKYKKVYFGVTSENKEG